MTGLDTVVTGYDRAPPGGVLDGCAAVYRAAFWVMGLELDSSEP